MKANHFKHLIALAFLLLTPIYALSYDYYTYQGDLTYTYDQMNAVGGGLRFAKLSLARYTINMRGTGSVIISEAVATSTMTSKKVTTLKEEVLSKFQYGEYIGEIYINAKVTDIPRNFASSNFYMSKVKFPYTVKTIGASAFSDCTLLKDFELPDSLETIQTSAFSNCKVMEELVLPNSVTTVKPFAFSGCISLRSVQISNQLSEIEESVFDGCCSLQKIVIPESVTTIGNTAFRDCSALVRAEFPSGLTSIGSSAFSNCTELKTVICNNIVPPSLGDDVFVKDAGVLIVPQESIEAYYNSEWAKYFSRIETYQKLTLNYEGDGRVYYGTEPVENGFVIEDQSNFTFMLLPNDNNFIKSITLDGADFTENFINHELVFKDYSETHYLNVIFAPNEVATLTVVNSDTHSITHTYTAGTQAIVSLKPESGWKVHTVEFNGKDVTNNLDNNILVTQPLVGDNQLHVVMEQIDTDVTELEVDTAIDIHVSGDEVTITGADSECIKKVYDLSGRVIYRGFDNRITLPKGQGYILTVANRTFKFVI